VVVLLRVLRALVEDMNVFWWCVSGVWAFVFGCEELKCLVYEAE